jgi:SAM-dependent methyltransferase
MQKLTKTSSRLDRSLPAYDLAANDRIPAIRALLPLSPAGCALDLGCGVGYTTSQVFAGHRVVCLDLHPPNLRHLLAHAKQIEPLCVVARATTLPFRDGVFRHVLCSEVLEHVEDDEAAVAEIARVMTRDGTTVITVPHSGLRFTSFLELLGIATVHDQPGPEHHVRSGYDPASLSALLASHGLRLEESRYCFRLVTRVLADVVSLAHLAYQRLRHGRRSWSWSDAALAEGSVAFRFFALTFPLLWLVSRLDLALGRFRGFGLVGAVRRGASASSRGDFKQPP